VSFEITGALGLIPALPLSAAGYAAVGNVARGTRSSAALALLSLACAVWCAAKLFLLPEAQRHLLCNLGPALRVGSLDVTFGLALDPASVGPVLAASATGSLIAFSVAFGKKHGAIARRELVGHGLLLATAELMLLAQGFFLTILAWGGATVACALLLGRAPSPLARLGGLLLIAGAALLFWVYGGRWDSSYTPALRPRLVAIASGDATSSGALRSGALTLSALPGARVGLGDAELCAVDADGRRGGIGLDTRPCREAARSPFANLPVPAALYDFHLYPGPGTSELLVEKAELRSGKETLLALLGPTLDFRELRAQLTLPALAKEHGIRQAVDGSELWGLPVLALALLIVVAAAAIESTCIATREEPVHALAALCGLATFGGVNVVMRLDFLLELAPLVASLGIAIGCVAGVRGAARALVDKQGQKLASLAAAFGGLALAGACAGAGASALLFLALASTALAAFALAEKPLPAVDSPLLRRIAGSPRSVSALLDRIARAAAGIGGALARIESALYGESKR